ncbi:hypothetical protein SCHPADRAFT_219771 [Schizopora paradoxa]|uniref:Uncharacterized protein n=1 Tax=Schizopora paradoxa TaxID=27342 RepID=A0A0H2RWK8_9AGAM|nr:hypothetical protein SCHPADRAFT_219771 [Schizopora paradoxa]
METSSLHDDSSDASNTSKELFASLIVEREISFEAVERILLAIKGGTFLFEEVKFSAEGLRIENVTQSTQTDAETQRIFGSYLQIVSLNPTEKLLALLVADASIFLKGMQRILLAVAADSLKTEELLSESMESLIFYRQKMRQRVLFESGRSSAFTQTFPRFILEALVDLLADTATPLRLPAQECIVGILERGNKKLHMQARESRRILECLALVHPSWTTTVYRALGRSVFISRAYHHNGRSPWTYRLLNPVYGAWTRDLEFELGPEHFNSNKAQYYLFVKNIPHRFPNLRSISMACNQVEGEVFPETLKMLLKLQDLEDMEIEYGALFSYNLENSASIFETLALFPRLQTLRLVLWPSALDELKIPSELAPLISTLRIRTLQLTAPRGRHFEDTLTSIPKLIWTRQIDDPKDAFSLTISQLDRLPRTFVSMSDRDKQSLTTLHVECTGETLWDPVLHNLEQFKSLRDVETVSKIPFSEVILESLPSSVESFLVAFPRTTSFSDVDQMLEKHISRGGLPSLKNLRVVRLYFDDKEYAYRRVKISSSIPLISVACQGRGIEYSAWF